MSWAEETWYIIEHTLWREKRYLERYGTISAPTYFSTALAPTLFDNWPTFGEEQIAETVRLTDYHIWEVEQQRIFFLCSHPEVYGTCADATVDETKGKKK